VLGKKPHGNFWRKSVLGTLCTVTSWPHLLASLSCKAPWEGGWVGTALGPGHCVPPLAPTQARCCKQSLGKGSSWQVSVGGTGALLARTLIIVQQEPKELLAELHASCAVPST